MFCHPPPQPGSSVKTRGALYAPARLALYTPNAWRDRKTVRVRFMDGDTEVWRQVEEVLQGPEGWSAACGFRFKFTQTDMDAEIRVTLTRGGSWSYLGNYCLGVPRDQPTMQFGWLDANTNPVEVRRVVLHEMGHAMGWIHEHSTAWANIPWDYNAIYEYYARTNGWSPTQVHAQVLDPYAAEVTQGSAYDSESIMGYCIKPEVVLDRKQRGCTNRLSATDRIMAQVFYGPPANVWHKTYLTQVSN